MDYQIIISRKETKENANGGSYETWEELLNQKLDEIDMPSVVRALNPEKKHLSDTAIPLPTEGEKKA